MKSKKEDPRVNLQGALWSHFSIEHDVQLLESEIADVEHIFREHGWHPAFNPEWVKGMLARLSFELGVMMADAHKAKVSVDPNRALDVIKNLNIYFGLPMKAKEKVDEDTPKIMDEFLDWHGENYIAVQRSDLHWVVLDGRNDEVADCKLNEAAAKTIAEKLSKK